MELIRQVLEARSVHAGHPRMPILVRRRTQPSCTHHVGRVHIFSEPWNPPETLPPKDTEDGVRLRAELNRVSKPAMESSIWKYGPTPGWRTPNSQIVSQPQPANSTSGPPHSRGTPSWPVLAASHAHSLRKSVPLSGAWEIRPDHSTKISGSPGSGFTELALSPRSWTPEDHGRLH